MPRRLSALLLVSGTLRHRRMTPRWLQVEIEMQQVARMRRRRSAGEEFSRAMILLHATSSRLFQWRVAFARRQYATIAHFYGGAPRAQGATFIGCSLDIYESPAALLHMPPPSWLQPRARWHGWGMHAAHFYNIIYDEYYAIAGQRTPRRELIAITISLFCRRCRAPCHRRIVTAAWASDVSARWPSNSNFSARHM